MPTNRHGLPLLLLILASSIGVTHAMSVSPAPLDELLDEAHLVVRGVIVEQRVEYARGPGVQLWTRYQLWVWEQLKAPVQHALPPEQPLHALTFTQPGGENATHITRVPGVVHFAPGDEVILLLVNTPQGLQPLGYPLGTFRIDPNGAVQPAWRGHGRDEVTRHFGSFVPTVPARLPVQRTVTP